MLKRWLSALAVACFAVGFVPGAAQADVPVPALKTRVTDLTGTLGAEQKDSLEQRLAAFEARKGSQIAVLMLPSTQPEPIEQFSMRVAEAWKIGRKGTDDGVILIVAKDDRRLRIEVGYGLEGAIPDATAKRVISDTITPRFKAGDFYGGVSAGVDQLIRLVDGEKLPPPSPSGAGQGSVPAQGGMDPFEYLIPGVIFIVVVGSVLKAVLGRFPGALVSGVVAGLFAWFLFSVVVGGIVGFVAFILTLANSGNISPGGGGFSSGSSGGSSSWGGGGGGFGGGGSSGRW
jgi:uncharacterized protein